VDRWLDRPAAILGLLTLALHIWINGSYGYFRDELYFIVCGRHLAWGYVDQPPLTPLLAWASDAAFGSLRGLRLVPALACAGTVALTAAGARLLGGGRIAAWLAGLAALGGGALQLFGVLLSTDTLLPFTWLASGLALVRIVRNGDVRFWWAIGALAIVATLAKYTSLAYFGCLIVSLLATPQRRILAEWRVAAAAGLAALVVAPNIAWQSVNNWPFFSQGVTLSTQKNVALSPLAFGLQEVMTLGPMTVLVWLPGLTALAFLRRFADLRWIAISFAALVAATIVLHGKPYYPAAAYPLLMAAGSVALESWLWSPLRVAALALQALGAVMSAPLVMPALPVDKLIAYQRWLGLQPSTGERVKVGVLPQYFADMFGWRELGRLVADVAHALPSEDRAKAVFFGRNYGEAAAVEYFGAALGAPPAISAHQNYFLWGPGDHTGEVVLMLAEPRDQRLQAFRNCEPVGRLDNPLGQPEESNQTLWLCRDIVEPLSRLWLRWRKFR
jgi:hypothetical protein